MIRLFVALPVPRPVRQHLALLCGGLPGARWVAPEDFHITLRFIGDVSLPVADDVVTALDRIRSPGFTVTLRGLDLFGDRRRARSLHARVVPDADLEALAAKVSGALARVPGCPQEDRRFVPHVTLARLKGADPARLAALLQADGDLAPAPWPAEWFGLYSSHPGSDPPHYTLETRFDLTATG